MVHIVNSILFKSGESNRCVIEVLVAFLVLPRCFFLFSCIVGLGAFVIELSPISSSLLLAVEFTLHLL